MGGSPADAGARWTYGAGSASDACCMLAIQLTSACKGLHGPIEGTRGGAPSGNPDPNSLAFRTGVRCFS